MEDEAKVREEAKARNELIAMIIAEDDEEVLKKLLVFVKKLIDEQEGRADNKNKLMHQISALSANRNSRSK